MHERRAFDRADFSVAEKAAKRNRTNKIPKNGAVMAAFAIEMRTPAKTGKQ